MCSEHCGNHVRKFMQITPTCACMLTTRPSADMAMTGARLPRPVSMVSLNGRAR